MNRRNEDPKIFNQSRFMGLVQEMMTLLEEIKSKHPERIKEDMLIDETLNKMSTDELRSEVFSSTEFSIRKNPYKYMKLIKIMTVKNLLRQ